MVFQKSVNLIRLYVHIASSISPCNVLTCRQSVNAISTSAAVRRKKLTAAEALKIKSDVLVNDDEYANTFGNFDNLDVRFERVQDDPDDIKEYEKSRAAKGESYNYYMNEIRKSLEKNEYEKAVSLLEVDMLNDRHPISHYPYRLLLSYNAKLGDIEEAYRLFTNYKKRGGRVDKRMYTSLFDACANSKNSFLALEKASAIREHMMRNKDHKINLTNYNSMLKAYGRHGDLLNCFKIVDEILARRDKVKSETYCFLLQACISDKNSGLRHALITWRKMLQNRCAPSIYEFNTMLRCVRDCFLGDVDLLNAFIQELKSESEKFFKRKVLLKKTGDKIKRKIVMIPVPKEEAENKLLAQSDEKETLKNHIIDENTDENSLQLQDTLVQKSVIESEPSEQTLDIGSIQQSDFDLVSKSSDHSSKQEISDFRAKTPNLLALTPVLGSVIKFGSMTKPYERFLCVGGVKGFLKTMKAFGVKPDVKTFTLLLDVVPDTVEAEEDVIARAKSHNVKLDTGFFNVLIKRRIDRDKNVSLEDVLKRMQEAELSPDAITFGVLALGCTTHEKGIELIKAVRSSGYRVSNQLLGGLLQRANDARDMNYVKTILDAAKEDDTSLSMKFIGALSNVVKREKFRREKEKKEIDTLDEGHRPQLNAS